MKLCRVDVLFFEVTSQMCHFLGETSEEEEEIRGGAGGGDGGPVGDGHSSRDRANL